MMPIAVFVYGNKFSYKNLLRLTIQARVVFYRKWPGTSEEITNLYFQRFASHLSNFKRKKNTAVFKFS